MTISRQRVAPSAAAPSAERVSKADRMQLAMGGGGTSGQVGAILVLGAGRGDSVADARRLLAERIQPIPRFRQRLHRPPPGRGRPYWAGIPAFDALPHITEVVCPSPGDDRALLDVAAACLTTPLPADRPLWSATFVTGLTRGRTGLVIVVNHVIADGVAGLTVLGKLADPPAAGSPAGPFPGPTEASGPAGSSVRSLRAGLAELGGRRLPHRAVRTSLNRPTGPRRRIDVVPADLAAVREFAHAHGGTVNDVVLGVVAGALRDMLAARGEQLTAVTISVLVSARPGTPDGELGNQFGIMPVTVPTDGELGDRVSRIAAITRQRKSRARGSSSALLVPAFLLLARAGLLRPFVNHQRFVNTFVTNLRGPGAPLSLGGMPVDAVIALPATTGNVTVTFGVLSYAGVLRVTLLSDPARVADIGRLTLAVTRELKDLTSGDTRLRRRQDQSRNGT